MLHRKQDSSRNRSAITARSDAPGNENSLVSSGRAHPVDDPDTAHRRRPARVRIDFLHTYSCPRMTASPLRRCADME